MLALQRHSAVDAPALEGDDKSDITGDMVRLPDDALIPVLTHVAT